MVSSRDFFKRIGMDYRKTKNIKTEFDDITVVGGSQHTKLNPQRASHIQSIYTAIKGSYEKNKFRKRTKKQAIITIFDRVAARLNEHEHKTGEKIDDGLFVVALFRKYGKDTYPGHLLGKDAINIYHERLSELCYQTGTPKHSDRGLLKYLCLVRKESQDQVMLELKNAGIFSPGFIKKWKARGVERRDG